MAISLEKIYYTAMRKYDMKLVAGMAGLWNSISWIHTVEDIHLSEFLRGQELVIITGINHPNKEEIIEFTKRICDCEAGGLVFNLGPYIAEIPQEVIVFAEENDFPVFSIPWAVRLIDFNKEFCNLIIQGEQESQNLCGAFRNAIFSPLLEENYLPVIQREGLSKNEKYCMIKCMPRVKKQKANENDITKLFYNLRRHFEHILNKTQKKFVIFRYDCYITAIIPGTNQEEVHGITEKFAEYNRWGSAKGKLYFAVSKYDLGIHQLSENYETLSYMCKLSEKQKRMIWYWEELGVWNMLFSVGNMKVLENYKNLVIGELEKYDQENGTKYCKIVDAYLRLNGNMADVAAECFIHRNTVAYYLKKVEELIHCDIYSMEDRVQLYFAFRIREILLL